MDLSRIKKALAGVAVAAVSLTQAGTVFAAYSDVPAGVWYEEAVNAFVDAGYLDAEQTRFRGGDAANRAEFVKLVVNANGGILSTPPSVPSFDDVDTGAWYYGFFEEAGKEGWVRGDGDCYGTDPCFARPGANINRAEAAALIVRSFGLEYNGSAPQFVDVPNGQWYTDVIQTAADYCVLQGDDTTGRVRPADNMNRAEMVAMLYRAVQSLVYGTDCGDSIVPVDPMIKNISAVDTKTLEVEFNRMLDEESAEMADAYTITGAVDIDVTSAELIEGDWVRLMLASNTTAGASYTLTATDLMTTDGVEFSDSMEFNGYSDLVPSNGTLEVSLAASNPAADTVPKGALGVVMLSVDLTASCEDNVIVDRLTILHEGFGDEGDIEGLYAAIDGGRVSRKRTIKDEDQTADIRFASPLVITKCDTVTVDILGDFDTTADTAAEHNLVLELASDVSSNAKATAGNLPLRGNMFKVAAVSTGTIELEYRSVTPDEVEVGQNAALIGKFQLEAGTQQDESLYTITLENNGSASDGDYTNIAIQRSDGTVLTNTVAASVGDFVTLVFDPPYTLLEGDRVTLEIIADITGGAADTISMGLEENSDLFSVGSLYGYGVNGQLYGSQVALDGSPDTVSIDAGEFTVSIDGPASNDYTADDDDAVLANIIFESGSEVADVQTIFMMVEGQTSTSATVFYDLETVLGDVEIRNAATGQTIDGVPVTDASINGGLGYQVYRFDDFIVNGEQEFEFQVDFQESGSNPSNGDKFRVYVCAAPSEDNDTSNDPDDCHFNISSSNVTGTVNGANYAMDIEGLSTGDKIKDVRPNSTITGNFHEIAFAALDVSVQTLNPTETSVRNAKDINLLRFRARAGAAEAILLTSATFESASGSLLNANNYTLWVDSDGDEDVDTILETGVSSQNGRITFDELVGGGLLIAPEEDVLFEVHADVASSLQNSTNVIQLQFATGTNNFIEAEQADDGSSLNGIEYSLNNGAVQYSNCTATTDCEVSATLLDSTLFSLAQQGDLFITQDSTPTRSRQLLGGKVSDSILRLNMRSENEPVKVEALRLNVTGSASTISSLELFLDNSTTAFGTATTNNCGAFSAGAASGTLFCFSTQDPKLVIPEGSDVDVIVKARVKRDTAGGVSGEEITVSLLNLSQALEAEGFESSNPLAFSDYNGSATGEYFVGTPSSSANAGADVTGNTNDTVMAKIASIVDANPAADGTIVPSGPNKPVGQFTFAAASHDNSNQGLNDVILDTLIFNVTATNVTHSGYTLYNKADSSITSVCTPTNQTLTGSQEITCGSLAAAAVNTEIDQGESETFVLQATLTPGSDATYQVSLNNFNNRAVTGNIQWIDSDSSTSEPFAWVESAETVVDSTTYRSN